MLVTFRSTENTGLFFLLTEQDTECSLWVLDWPIDSIPTVFLNLESVAQLLVKNFFCLISVNLSIPQ